MTQSKNPGVLKIEPYAEEFIRRYTWSDGDTETGERVHCSDGSIWFHPFSGKQPVRVKTPTDI